MDEEKEKVEKGSENKTETAPAEESGDKPKVPQVTLDANAAAERLEKATAEQKAENNRTEELMAQKKLGGGSEAGKPALEKKEMTDTEYAEALQQGKVNPLKEDGFID